MAGSQVFVGRAPELSASGQRWTGTPACSWWPVARQGRLVLVTEDLQWADSATLDFLLFLTRAGRSDAMTVVATCRSDEMAVDPQVAQWLAHMRGGGQVAEIRLGPLSRDEVAEQITGLIGAPPPAGVADEVYARSEGNPFFAEQLVADALARPAGTGLGRPGGLPTRLAELLTARASGCRPGARAILTSLAVAGCPLTEDQLSGVSGLGPEAVRAGLQELATARLLAETEPDGRYRFAGHQDPATNAIIHERAARFRGLATAYLGGQEAPGPSIELITEALRLFDQAPPSAEHAEALFYYGHFLFVGQGRVEDGIEAVNRGLEIAEAAGATALIPRLLSIFAYHKFLQGQMDEGFAVLRRCQALTGSAGDTEAGILIDIYESDALLKTARFADAADVARGGLRAGTG